MGDEHKAPNALVYLLMYEHSEDFSYKTVANLSNFLVKELDRQPREVPLKCC